MKTEVLPLLVGLSLCGASAALLYIWYKTKDNLSGDTDVVDSAAGRKSTTTSAKDSKKQTKVECTIPNKIVPLLVGRGGANIKAIEEKTSTVIRFREKDDLNQICEISGIMENVLKAVDLVKQEASPPPNLTEEMYVPQSACGKIIGRCGEALQEICRKSMAKVCIDAGDRSDGKTRRVLITGTRANVNIAKSLIDEKIRYDVECRKKLEQNEAKREPRGNGKNIASANGVAEAAQTTNPLPKGEKMPANSLTNATDGQLEVYVSAIASPSRFWLQLVGPQSVQLDRLVETMTQYYGSEENQKFHRIADPYLGQIVTAMFKYDGKWYRAEIVGILPNEYNPRNVVLDLYFVDFGDSEYVAPHEVFELRTDFLTLRFQAIECFLAKVKSTNAADPDGWDPKAISRFEELTHVAKWRKMVSRVITTKERKYGDPVRREGSPVPGVELFDSAEGEFNIARELVREGFALEDLSEANNQRTDKVLRLDGGHAASNSSTPSDSSTPVTVQLPTVVPIISTVQHINGLTNGGSSTNNYDTTNDKDKFTAICENTTNENYENIKIDTTKNQTNSFIASERQNGNDDSNLPQNLPIRKTSSEFLDKNFNDVSNSFNEITT